MRKIGFVSLLIIAPCIIIFASLFIGRYPVDVITVMKVLLSPIIPSELEKVYHTVVIDVRLSRAILGALVGASLAISGAAFQGLFRNPLVSSGILGVSSGAGFGAALAIVMFNFTFLVYVFAFCFGVLAVVASYLIGRTYNTSPTIMLVLGGVIVSSIFSALISLVKYVADPYEQLPTIVFWLMGSLASARFQDIYYAGIPMVVGIVGLLVLRWNLNLLSMGEKEARTLGVNTGLIKGLVIGFATLATAGAVSVSGIIGWVGLVIPHIARMIVGTDNRVLIPFTVSLGACYLILVDNMARVLTGSEIPLGILTALIGGPFFVYILKKTKGAGWQSG
ncbi:ABC transporter permease [Desulfuribacillus alkaliarsenatis]|uniref:ABC transporter permease n=1 Tax=Desulfuribacillus alkaliarsenatis TaxID=766136 RepID=A0A1E5FZF1_9FIRM|nr:ABC transporter permease [Desulfuribacillus alkaliarsenatis]